MGIETAFMAAPLILQGFGKLQEGSGDAQGQRYEGERAKRVAEIARIEAAETDTTLRGELDTVLGSIRAIRASTGVDVNSPTSLAVMQREREVADRERRIRVGSARMQAGQADADSAFRFRAARTAMTGGVIRSLPYFFGAGQRIGGY